jgi:hypothetical protein
MHPNKRHTKPRMDSSTLIVIAARARGAIHQNTKTQLSQSLLKLKNTNTQTY